MRKINVPTRDQVSPDAQVMFDQIKQHLGKVPNLYATVGYSANTLKGFLAFQDALSKTAFTAKESEAISLVVSEVNNCNYCLAAHTLIATMKGYSKDDTLLLRRGNTEDPKLKAALQLAKAITVKKGEVEQQFLDDFFDAGYDESALIELIGLVTAKIFTNYVFALTAVPLDFPAAEELSQ
jgi:uncharacterized peroxidase-related enzyme